MTDINKKMRFSESLIETVGFLVGDRAGGRRGPIGTFFVLHPPQTTAGGVYSSRGEPDKMVVDLEPPAIYPCQSDDLAGFGNVFDLAWHRGICRVQIPCTVEDEHRAAHGAPYAELGRERRCG